MARHALDAREIMRKSICAWHIRKLIRPPSFERPDDAPFMTLLSPAQLFSRGSRERSRGHLLPITVGCAVGACPGSPGAYFLWSTCDVDASYAPRRLPVSLCCD